MDMATTYDLIVIGGGINGVGIARDAAGRGLKVALVEQDDLAAHTSSASSKLIHGGIRYLEQYEFGLVRKALREREMLLGIAPHIAWPMRFVLPHDARLRPKWMIRIGLLLYDWLDPRRRLPRSRAVRLDAPPYAGLLAPQYRDGFVYSDCWVDDARLVVLNATDAQARGATILTRHRCTALTRGDGGWIASVAGGGTSISLHARAVVNAAGPWVADLAAMASGDAPDTRVRLVKGSHIVVPKMFGRLGASPHGFIFQNDDGRIVFALPYEDDFTLIGTTDAPAPTDLAAPEISDAETDYLLDAANDHFAATLTTEDVVWSYAGVRSLYDDGSTDPSDVTRDYVLQLDDTRAGAPIVHVIGGKITTYRRLAEDALAKLGHHRGAWTAGEPLPGGDIGPGGPAVHARRMIADHPGLPARLLTRLARRYGSRCSAVLGEALSVADLGEHFGADLYAAEVGYLIAHEFARTAEDVVWRRTKAGLRLTREQIDRLDAWMAARLG